MKRKRSLRGLAVVFIAVGLALLIYFGFVYDPWAWVDASPPPGVDAFGEEVLHEDPDRLATARIGRWVGLGALAAGTAILGSLLLRSSEGHRGARCD